MHVHARVCDIPHATFLYTQLDARFLARQETLALIRHVFRTKENFACVTGPSGCGKSVAVYVVACLARQLGWAVLYIVRINASFSHRP